MAPFDFCELSVEQEEYLVELLFTRGACAVDWWAWQLDALCRVDAPLPLRNEPFGAIRDHRIRSSSDSCASSSLRRDRASDGCQLGGGSDQFFADDET